MHLEPGVFWEIPQISVGEDTVSIRTMTRSLIDRKAVREMIGELGGAREGEEIDSKMDIPNDIGICVKTKTTRTSRGLDD